MPTPPINEHALTERRAATQRIQAFINRHHDRVDEQYVRGLRAGMLLVEHEDLAGAPQASSDPVPSNPTAPAVDDDLLRDLGFALDRSTDEGMWPRSSVRDLLASGPMQRLRAAWTAELLEASGRVTTRLESELATAVRERDEARAELAAKRDELRMQVEHRQWAEAEVERLRAAVPDLPDVGPVRRDERGQVWIDNQPFDAEQGPAQDHRFMAAEHLAVADFLDREAEKYVVDTPTDETFVLAADKTTAAALLAEFGNVLTDEVDSDWLSIVRALDAHRARTPRGDV